MSDVLLKEPETPEEIVPETTDEIADLLAAQAPEGTFEVDLPGGRTLLFRYPRRYGEVRLFWRSLVEFWAQWNDPDDLIEELKPYAPEDWSEAYAAYLVYFWAAPENRFSHKAALRLLANPWIMDSLKRQIEDKQKTLVEAVATKEIDEAEKGLPETSSTGSGSGPAETPSESTPTS